MDASSCNKPNNVGDKLSPCRTPFVTSNQSVNILLFHFKHDVVFVYIRFMILYTFPLML